MRNIGSRSGAEASPAPAGCAGCGHPFTLHSNGTTPCKASGCTAGHAAPCPSCNGTTVSLVTLDTCIRCEGRGTVPTPCQGFTAPARLREVPELLAS